MDDCRQDLVELKTSCEDLIRGTSIEILVQAQSQLAKVVQVWHQLLVR